MSVIGVALARNADTSRKIILRFQCEPDANVFDLVYIDPMTPGKVLVSSTNTLVDHTIGVIDSKPQASLCEVLVLGTKDGYTGLVQGEKIYLGVNGAVSSEKPPNGYAHILGFAISSSEVLFIPNSIKVKLS